MGIDAGRLAGTDLVEKAGNGERAVENTLRSMPVPWAE